MCYRVITDYYRQEHFDLYTAYGSPYYDVTVPFDITAVRRFARDHGYSLYLTLCYFFTRATTSIEDFRYRYRDGQIVHYERLHPGLTVPAPENRFSFANCRYHDDFATFHNAARGIVEDAGRAVTLAEAAHSNYLFFTALPAVPFNAFSHPRSSRNTDAEPKVAFGQFSEKEGKLEVPAANSSQSRLYRTVVPSAS